MIERDMSSNNELGPMVPYSKLYSLASKQDRLLMYLGWICAGICGFGMPSFVFLIGNVIDSFTPAASTGDTLAQINQLSLIFTLIGLGIWFISYVMYACLLISSERTVRATRTEYLKTILKQDSSWFDTINPSELSARLSKETAAI